jgi:hypothetical protein
MVGGLRSLIMAFPMPVPGYFFKKSDLLHSIVIFSSGSQTLGH